MLSHIIWFVLYISSILGFFVVSYLITKIWKRQKFLHDHRTKSKNGGLYHEAFKLIGTQDEGIFYDSKLAKKYFMMWSEKCYKAKDETVILNFFLRPWVLTCNPEYVKEILLEKSEKWKKSVIANSIFEHILGRGILTAEGKIWKQQRNLLGPCFTSINIGRLTEKMEVYGLRNFKTWKKLYSGKDGNIRNFDAVFNYSNITVRIIGACAFGVSKEHLFLELDEKWNGLLGEDFYTYFAGISALPEWLYRRIPLPSTIRYLKRLDDMKKLTQYLIDKKNNYLDYLENKSSLKKDERDREDDEKEDDNDILSTLLKLKRESPDKISDYLLLHESVTFLLTGHSTTLSVISWLSVELCANPDVQEKLYKEIASFFKNKKENTHVTLDELKNLTYLQSCIKETLRHHPPVLEFDKETISPVYLGDYYLGAGIDLGFNVWGLHHHPKYWKDPLKFWPERWLEKDFEKKVRYLFCPYSLGSRDCLGRLFGTTEVGLLICHLLNEYEFKFSGNLTYNDVGTDAPPISRPYNFKMDLIKRNKSF